MSELDKERISNFYHLKCESIADELYHSDSNICGFIQDTIENIENVCDRDLLTNFEKIVCDYFTVNNLPLDCDIFKYL